MIIVTGAAGFIGSNIVKGLNTLGRNDIVVTDDLTDGDKFKNLNTAGFLDYIDFRDLEKLLPKLKPEIIFHQGACSSTTEKNGVYMLERNYNYSKMLLEYSLASGVRFLYASSASVYGNGKNGFKESPECESPLNVYAFSKFIFDRFARDAMKSSPYSQIAGLRYFNVYGPGESHKGSMASVAYHLYRQVKAGESIKLFEGSGGFLRDFIYVDDVVKVNLFLMENPKVSGIFNCGTGRAESFQAVADVVQKRYSEATLEYIPFPTELAGKYQTFTEADMSLLRNAGFKSAFLTVTEGVTRYLDCLESGD